MHQTNILFVCSTTPISQALDSSTSSATITCTKCTQTRAQRVHMYMRMNMGLLMYTVTMLDGHRHEVVLSGYCIYNYFIHSLVL